MGQSPSVNRATGVSGAAPQPGSDESRTLLNLIVQLTNSQAGKDVPARSLWMNDAQVLALKFYYHLTSLHVLLHPVEVVMPEGTVSHIDHSSMLVLSRAALETFLTFAHVFGCSETDLREFRHMTWRCAGLLDRQKLQASARLPQSKQKLIDEG